MRIHSLALAPTLTAMAFALLAPPNLRGEGGEKSARDDAKNAVQPVPFLGSVTMKGGEVDDIADALGIKIWSGAFELSRAARAIRLVLDFYQDGKCVETVESFPVVDKAESRGEFAIQVVDLDYLPLRDGKRHNWRVFGKLKFGSTISTNKQDFAKNRFEFGSLQSSVPLDRPHGTPKEAPLFFITFRKPDAKSKPDSKPVSITDRSPADLIAHTSDFSLVIARLVCDDDDLKEPDQR